MLALLIAAALSVPTCRAGGAIQGCRLHRRGASWRTNCDDPGTPSYEPGSIETYRDLNGDGRPEAVITEGGTFCYGNTGTGFWLLTRRPDARWIVLHQSQGVAEFLPTRGIDRMPDISVGGPGFCFPVLRWDGKAYAPHGFQYEGKTCRQPR